MKNRIKRNIDFVVFLIIFLFLVFNFVSTGDITSENSEDFIIFLNSVLSFTSIITAFLFFTVSFLPLLREVSSLFSIFKFDIKLLDRIMVVTFYFFALSISILMLIFIIYQVDVIDNSIVKIFISLLLLSVYMIVTIFYDFFKELTNEINK